MSNLNQEKLPEQSSRDTLTFSADLWWLFHEMDAECGMKSSTGAQLDALELGTTGVVYASDGPTISLACGRRLARLRPALEALSEADYGVLRVWYCRRTGKPASEAVKQAHGRFYAHLNPCKAVAS